MNFYRLLLQESMILMFDLHQLCSLRQRRKADSSLEWHDDPADEIESSTELEDGASAGTAKIPGGRIQLHPYRP